MRNFSKVALAVAATLAGSSAFAVANVTPSTTFTVTLNVAGSSAFQSQWPIEMANVLCSDDVVTFDSNGGPGLAAYGCTLKTSVTGKTKTYTFPANTFALVYYRSEGGSVYGVGPLAKNIQQLRLSVSSANCTTGSGTLYHCPVGALNLSADTVASGAAVKAYVELGASDVEPSRFIGENWPAGGFLGDQPTPTQLATLTSKQNVVAQVFALYVNDGISATPLNLSKQAVSSIFSGLYTDWSQVPKADGSGFVSDGTAASPITVCERDIGSGTQTSMSIYFMSQGCSNSATTFIDNTPNRNASTGSEMTCVSTTAGAIGYAAVQKASDISSKWPHAVAATLSGVTASTANAAAGLYDLWYEATFQSGAKLTANANGAALADVMITRLKNAATTPAGSPSVFALPIGSNASVLPVSSTHPVALGTRGGDSCSDAIGQNSSSF